MATPPTAVPCCTGYGNLLDTDALDGLLDPETAPSTRRWGRSGASAGRSGVTDTNHMFGSLMDTGSLEALVSQNQQQPMTRRSHLMGTHMMSSFGSALDTSDIMGHMMEHKGALRATIWLFKSDQPDAWCGTGLALLLAAHASEPPLLCSVIHRRREAHGLAQVCGCVFGGQHSAAWKLAN